VPNREIVRTLYRFIPAVVAAANGIAVAGTVYFNQPGDYPGKLLFVQVAIVFAALLIGSGRPWVRGAGFLLTIVGIFLTFSAMFLYVPTFVAAVWRMATWPSGAE
jgi:hypothetical protein